MRECTAMLIDTLSTLDLLENEKVIHVLLKARELFRDTCSRVIYDLGLQVAASNG